MSRKAGKSLKRKNNAMLISEVLGKSTNDIIKESDEYVLKSILDTIIIRIKEALEHNESAHFTLSQVIEELNNNTDTLYIDPRDEDRRNQVMSELEQHGLDVERGSGRIHFAKDDPVAAIDDEEAEEKDFEREISRKAMDKVKKDSEDGDTDLL